MLILELENISKSFRIGMLGKKRRVLSDLSFSLKTGEIFGFLGHNGAGKTTTIKIILGFLKPDKGKVSVLGSTGITPRSLKRIGFLSENVGLYAYLTAKEMLGLTGRFFGIPKDELRIRTGEMLRLAGLEETGGLKIKKFSKGMRQRLGIAIALINNPDILLLDEPYSGLDPLGRKDLKEVLLSLKKEGKTILLSSHIVPDVESVCDRVGILKNGGIARFLDMRDLYETIPGCTEVTASGISPEELCAEMKGVVLAQSHNDAAVFKCEREDMLKTLIDSIYSQGGEVMEVRRAKATLEDYLIKTLRDQEAGDSDVDGAKTNKDRTLIMSDGREECQS